MAIGTLSQCYNNHKVFTGVWRDVWVMWLLLLLGV
jgi:hypothetical protein